jgi:hypothetical protein
MHKFAILHVIIFVGKGIFEVDVVLDSSWHVSVTVTSYYTSHGDYLSLASA